MSIGENYRRIASQVADCAQEQGRDAGQVCLIAVSKTVDAPVVAQAIAAGAHDFGENRPECLVQKAQAYPDQNWHFIGNIQSRRIGDIVEHACLIHSLFQESHARKISSHAASLGKVQDVLIEVNVSGEESKGGCTPAQAIDLVRCCLELPGVRPRGLMTMAPQGSREEALRTFQGLAQLRDQIRSAMEPDDAAVFNELSMGMSEDWPEAIACGATMVRIVRAIFSEEPLVLK